MKSFVKSATFKAICVVAGLLLLGMVIAALFDTSASAQSSVLGTVFYPAERLACIVSEKLGQLGDNASGKSSYQSEIDALRLEVANLQEQLVDYENTKRENAYYEDFLEVKEEHSDFNLVKATVLARDSEQAYSSFTISAGKADGVNVDDCVIYGKYLVGVVVRVYPKSAVVRTILDPSVSVSVYEASTGEISYTGNSAKSARSGKFFVENLSKDTAITQNGIVCTSGIGGIYPKDLILGTVDSVDHSKKDVSFVATVTPAVDFANLTGLFVVTDFADKEVEVTD